MTCSDVIECTGPAVICAGVFSSMLGMVMLVVSIGLSYLKARASATDLVFATGLWMLGAGVAAVFLSLFLVVLRVCCCEASKKQKRYS